MKRNIAIFLIVLMAFSILPINEFISLASSFEPDLIHDYNYFQNHGSDPKLVEAKAYLNAIDAEPVTKNGKVLNPIIYAMYGIEAYGFPHGDAKTPDKFQQLVRKEYRYLGFDLTGKEPITNSFFPNDETGDLELEDKNWQKMPGMTDSWKKSNVDANLIEYMLAVKDIRNNGISYDKNMKGIMAKKATTTSELKKYINLQSISKLGVWGSLRPYSKGGDGVIRYQTFDIPPLAGDKTLEINIEPENNYYQMTPNDDYIDVLITVEGKIRVEDAFLETYIKDYWVKLDSSWIKEAKHTFTKRIYKKNLDEGLNIITFDGATKVESKFPNDVPLTKEGQAEIKVMVSTDELIVALDLPKKAAINQEYEVKDISYIPDGHKVIYSRLQRQVGSADPETIETWGKLSKSTTESYPIKATIKYILTIETDHDGPQTVEKTMQIIDDRSVDATADLELDEWTYEGHPAYARDVSHFDVEGETYNASRAYDEGLASNRFEVVENTPHDLDKLSDTKTKIIFDESGYYNVELRVRPKGGEKLYDIEPIEVRKTPYINDFLGGTQKENRKQILNISVAIHPDHPIPSNGLWVEVKDVTTGEKVNLKPDGNKKNSATIKTRAITENKETYFQNYTLEFLTKNDIEKKYQYKIYATDAKGDTASVTKTFTVYPDLPPDPQISLLDSYIRSQNSNTAKIETECSTVSKDGDQVERIWSVAFDTNHNNSFADETYKNINTIGYNDLSFGTKQKIDFNNKTGVGKFKMRLDVKEVWVEPTLDEYVTDSDRLTAFTTKNSEVVNIAPMVSLEPKQTYKEDVLILTTEKDLETAKINKTILDQYFKENVIDSNINIASFSYEDLSPMRKVFSLRQDLADCYDSTWTAMTASIDNHKIYRIIPTAIIDEDNIQGPFIVEAWDIEKNKKVWSYTTPLSRFKFNQDDKEKYLYLVCDNTGTGDDKTILIDKQTGSKAAELNFIIEGKIYYTEEGIYIFSDGAITKLDNSTLALETIYNIGSETSKIIGGKIHFVYSDDICTYRGIFDPNDESIESQYLLDNSIDNTIDNSGSEPYKVKHFDDYGTVHLTKYHQNNYRDILHLNRVYDSNNQLIKTVQDSYFIDSYRDVSYYLIEDEYGKAKYIHRSWFDVHADRWTPWIYELYGDKIHVDTKDVRSTLGVMYRKYRNSQNDILFIIKGDERFDGYSSHRGKPYKYKLDSEEISVTDLQLSAPYMEYTQSADRYFATGCSTDEQELYVNKNRLTLEYEILRVLNKNAYFREDAQRNVVIIDGENTNNADMPELKNALNKLGVKLTVVKKGSSNYLDKLKNAVGGKKITYTNMKSILTAVGSNINNDKETVSNPVIKVKGQGNSNATLDNEIILEVGNDYIYEYDIKYTNKGSMSNADIFNLSHDIQDIRAASKQVAVCTEKTQFDHFYYYYDRNRFFNMTGDWTVRNNTLYTYWKSLKYKRESTKTENINLKLDKDSILSFDYDYTYDRNDRKPKVYENYFKIKLDNVQIMRKAYENDTFHFSRLIPKGEHTLSLSYKAFYKKHHAEIDNLQLVSIEKRNDGSYDSGKLSKDNKIIKQNEWQHIEGAFKTPYEVCQYTKTGTKSANYRHVANSFVDDSNNIYTASKVYNGNSTIKLGYSSTSDSEFQIKNLKIYRLEDGKKILWKDYGVMTQEMLDEEFATNTNRAQITIDDEPLSTEQKDPPLIYKKGELVVYNVYYNDYENDPSKKQYWQYTHTPFNDGIHPEANKILSAPIDRFWVDGKYVVKHWQEDNTGVTSYDKVSNKEEITFYVQGSTAVGPEITYIKTIPETVKDGNKYKIKVGVDDEDKDPLHVTIELYKNSKLIYTYTKNNVSPVSGIYPPILSGYAPTATEGNFTVVVTVSDGTATALDSYDFNVKVDLKIINAALMPNPALAGDELIFTIETKGNVERIEIVIPSEIASIDNRTGKYSYPLVYNVDSSVETKTDVFKYISNVNVPKTLTPDNNRIRPPYTFVVRAWKGSTYKEIPLTLDVKRSVLDLIKPMIRDFER